jgi:hypothetical protein
MSSSNTNIVQIVKSGTELWANQWISWWVKFTCDTIWLEAENSSSNEIDIISPSGYDWVSFNRSAWNSSSGETLFESLPSVGIGDLFTFTKTITNESVFTLTI